MLQKKKQEEAKQQISTMPKPATDDVINRLLNQTPQSIESILNPQPA